jgi:CubicO group peptidase (beta-lactamase class C family)
MSVHGDCDPRFLPVRDEFLHNFAHKGEVGASVCVLIDGRPVVDLWGGFADRHTQAPWQRDTLGVVFSCTKGAVALCALLLASRGRLDLDAPVSTYWPEFAANGKDAIPVSWLLSHQAGLPVIRAPLRPGDAYDWETMTRTLAAEAPWFEPGTRQAYGAGTMGHLVGEVVRRVDGRPLDAYFRDEVATGLSLDFHLGLPGRDEPRVAATIKADPTPPGEPLWRFLQAAKAGPESIQGTMMRNAGRSPGDTDTREAHAAVLPSSGGITNARGLAGLYAACVRLLDRSTLRRAAAVQSASAIDGTLLVGMRFGLGFMLSSDNRRAAPGARDSLLLSPTAFGHAGMGGSLGFADPAHRLSFGYTMNKLGRGVLLNARGQSLVDAVYRCLGAEPC